jgi:hypothetical protein
MMSQGKWSFCFSDRALERQYEEECAGVLRLKVLDRGLIEPSESFKVLNRVVMGP